MSFTLVAFDTEIAALDARQYLSGGPRVAGAVRDVIVEVNTDGPLDEGEWQLFAQTAAAHGIASTLTIPLRDGAGVTGSVNQYGATAGAFQDHHSAPSRLVGGRASEVTTNADLSFSTRAVSERAPSVLRAQAEVDIAAGMLSAALDVDVAPRGGASSTPPGAPGSPSRSLHAPC